MSINLIPPKLKKERKERKTTALFFTFLTFYLILFCILSAVIYLADTYIKKSLSNMDVQIAEETLKANNYKDVEANIKLVNGKLDSIKKEETSKIYWSKILDELARSTPENAQIKILSSSTENKSLNITGDAASRRDIAKLKDKMEDSKYFKNVNFSTSSYNETDKNFTFNLTCELEEVK